MLQVFVVLNLWLGISVRVNLQHKYMSADVELKARKNSEPRTLLFVTVGGLKMSILSTFRHWELSIFNEWQVVSENCLAVWRMVRQGLVLAMARPRLCVLCCRGAAAGHCRCLQEADQGHQAGQTGSSLSPLSRHPGHKVQLSLGAELLH